MKTIDEFKNIPGLTGYSVCLVTGRVRHDPSGQCLRQCWGRAGSRCYWQVSVRGQTCRIHRLLASAAAGRELLHGEQVCHRDGDTSNNDVSNLSIGTALDNSQDRLRHNTYGWKLRNQDVREIRLLSERKSNVDIARQYGITPGHVSAIVNRRAWRGLP